MLYSNTNAEKKKYLLTKLQVADDKETYHFEFDLEDSGTLLWVFSF